MALAVGCVESGTLLVFCYCPLMRSAALFLLAIFTPCALLGWVSWRSMRDEANDIRRQRTTLYQQSADNAARNAAALMAGQVREFGETVERMLTGDALEQVRTKFHMALRKAWPMASAGLVLDANTGALLAQVEPSEQAVTAFVIANTWFFHADAQPLYVDIPADNPPLTAPLPALVAGAKSKAVEKESMTMALESLAKESPPAPEIAPAKPAMKTGPETRSANLKLEAPADPQATTVSDTAALSVTERPFPAAAMPTGRPSPPPYPVTPAASQSATDSKKKSTHHNAEGNEPRRTVRPLFSAPSDASVVKPVTTTLAALVALHSSGMINVPRNDGLFTLIWYRTPRMPQEVFSAVLDRTAFLQSLQALPATAAPDDDTSIAILDHRAQPAAQWTRDGTFTPASWSQPLVAREPGAALPRWEAAIFLRNPEVFTKAAATARWRLGIIVATASLTAIAGALFILRDSRRAALEARQKTDFVSNVSHELKTPLTSIRLLSDLLAANPASSPDKTKRYAEVIASEAARLTRLINNVLNFSRMERGSGEMNTAPLDLAELTKETADHIRPQLEKAAFTLEVSVPEHPVTLRADADAISQVLLNLLSNAEKYGSAPDKPRRIVVSLHGENNRALLKVSDHGNGVPRGHERRIFEKFQRAHDTLASGTAGSGLGLTIARRLIEAHGGTLEYSRGENGGAVFTVSLPASPEFSPSSFMNSETDSGLAALKSET